MPLRVFLFSIFMCLAASACKNEPYEYPPLGVIGLINHVTNVNNTYRYRDQKLYTYLSVSTDTIAWMKFSYLDGQLQKIVSDSTRASKKVTTFYRNGGEIVTDTTVLIDTINSRLVSARSVTYAADGNPVNVNVKNWTDTGITEELAELTWDDDNVIRLTTYKVSPEGERSLVRDLTIAHDAYSCVYMKNNDYLFILALPDLFWLSKNNPLVFNDGDGEKKYTYWYNKLGYPSNFKSETGVLFGASYTQVR